VYEHLRSVSEKHQKMEPQPRAESVKSHPPVTIGKENENENVAKGIVNQSEKEDIEGKMEIGRDPVNVGTTNMRGRVIGRTGESENGIGRRKIQGNRTKRKSRIELLGITGRVKRMIGNGNEKAHGQSII
jgi:hypothetical protein